MLKKCCFLIIAPCFLVTIFLFQLPRSSHVTPMIFSTYVYRNNFLSLQPPSLRYRSLDITPEFSILTRPIPSFHITFTESKPPRSLRILIVKNCNCFPPKNHCFVEQDQRRYFSELYNVNLFKSWVNDYLSSITIQSSFLSFYSYFHTKDLIH